MSIDGRVNLSHDFNASFDYTPMASPPISSRSRPSFASPRRTNLLDGRPDAITWEKLAYLRKLNVFFALVLAGAGAAAIVLRSGVQTPVFAVFAESTFFTHEWWPKLKHEFNFTLSHACASILILSSIYHFLCGTLLRDAYESALVKHQNPFRYVHFAVVNSIAKLLLAALVGVMDVHLYFSILCLTATSMLFGLLQEQFNQSPNTSADSASLLPFFCGALPHLACWSILLCHFLVGVAKAAAPAFVWVVVLSAFCFDALQTLNQYLQQRELARWSDYMFCETMYSVLSMLALQTLVWVVYFGTRTLA